jgi:hypothetical protein
MAASSSRDAGSSSLVSLADLGLNAIDLFHKVEKALIERADKACPENMFLVESERFELWAANMGLFVKGHGSLDYRVREAERIAQTLREFMQDLVDSLEEGKASWIGLNNQDIDKARQCSRYALTPNKKVHPRRKKVAQID